MNLGLRPNKLGVAQIEDSLAGRPKAFRTSAGIAGGVFGQSHLIRSLPLLDSRREPSPALSQMEKDLLPVLANNPVKSFFETGIPHSFGLFSLQIKSSIAC